MEQEIIPAKIAEASHGTDKKDRVEDLNYFVVFHFHDVPRSHLVPIDFYISFNRTSLLGCSRRAIQICAFINHQDLAHELPILLKPGINSLEMRIQIFQNEKTIVQRGGVC